jgi:hypothetical protein
MGTICHKTARDATSQGQITLGQFCGSEFNFFGFGFRSTNFFSDSDLYTYILTRNLLKWCLSLLFYVFWNLYYREKSFLIEKPTFIPLSRVWSAIFHTQKKNFILQQCLDPNPNPNFFRIRIQPKYSDYFGFGSTTLPQGYILGTQVNKNGNQINNENKLNRWDS